MNRSTNVRRGVAAGIAGAGLALGGLSIASAAEDGARSEDATRASGHGHGPGRGQALGGSELAEALGVSESELQSALDSVRDQFERPETDGGSTPPAEGELEERRDQMSDALAEELGLSAAEVTAALEELHQGHEDERRAALDERLDDAVSEGDLTAEDRASVLKAFDAGVLVGGPGGASGAR